MESVEEAEELDEGDTSMILVHDNEILSLVAVEPERPVSPHGDHVAGLSLLTPLARRSRLSGARISIEESHLWRHGISSFIVRS